MATHPYPDEPTWWRWFDGEVLARYQQVGRTYPDPTDPDTFVWRSRCGYSASLMPKEQAAAKHLAELDAALGLNQPVPGVPTNRPLVGPLRVVNKLFADDTGYRRVFFCSWFPALRILRDNPTEFYRQLDVIAAANYQGFRTFLSVGGWTPFWDGREVVPLNFRKWQWTGNFLRTDAYGANVTAWHDYVALLRTLLRACRARKLRLHVTFGDLQITCPDGGTELQLHQLIADVCAEEGGTDVIALAEATNEFPINRFGGDSSQSIEQMGRVLRVWETAIPGILTAQGAIPVNEEPESLERASTYGDVCAVHVTRSPFETCLKHTLGLVYWEGNYRAFPKPFWEGEPAGPGQDSHDPLNDPASLVALHAMIQLTGQAGVYFNGPAVRSMAPLESTWGFKELPVLLANRLPEDVALWAHGSNRRGGIEYWWKDRQFATATYQAWDTSPPRPVASWTLYTGTEVRSGTGTPPRATGLLVGSFQE